MSEIKLISKKKVKYTGQVYDLTVEDDHSYNIKGIPVHNSAAGSLVSFCLKITNIDPIKYDLLFERFLNPDRVGSPNITTKELSFKEFNSKILPAINEEIDIDYR